MLKQKAKIKKRPFYRRLLSANRNAGAPLENGLTTMNYLPVPF